MALRENGMEQVQFRTADGLTLVGDAWGNPDRPPVIFMHGGGQTRHAWGRAATRVAEHGRRAITIDQRGHGESDWSSDGQYSVELYAQDLIGVAQEMEQPPVVVGASLGGMAAMFAHEHDVQDAFAGIVLVDIAPNMQMDGVAKIMGFMTEHVEQGFADVQEAADAIAAYLPHREPPKDLSGLQKNLRLCDDERYRWHWDPKFIEGMVPPEDQRDRGRLSEAVCNITAPTLLVRGGSSELVTEEDARAFIDLVPHAEYVDVSGAHHMVAGDRNDAFNNAVLAFLEKLD